MKKKDASFWSDIKTLDERLKKDPESFCFARLSEIYLKVGLVADALHTARSGVARHPGYLAGQRALGLACNASGLHDEARAILEHVTAAIPEDVDAQKVLAGLHVASGDLDAAIRAYATVLEFRPEDKVSSTELESLRQAGGTYPPVFRSVVPSVPPVFAAVAAKVDEDIIELSESDIYEELAEEASAETSAFGSGIAMSSERHDPLSTLTLAELYEKQGFSSKALDIYRTLLADDPTNVQLLAKLAELEGGEIVDESGADDESLVDFEEEAELSVPESFDDTSGAIETEISPEAAEFSSDDFTPEISGSEVTEPVAEFSTDDFEPMQAEVPVEPVSDFVAEAFESEQVPDSMASSTEPEPFAAETFEASSVDIPVTTEFQEFEAVAEVPASTFDSDFSVPDMSDMTAKTIESAAFAPLAHKSADNVLETLDSWLENIRRIKACR